MIEQEKVFANGFNHHLRKAGASGPDMVLLHGWPQTSYCWRHLMDALSGDYLMVAPDLRGIGDTGKPDGSYDKATVAGDIWAIMDTREIEKAILVGHDIGARVAMRMTLDNPGRVAALVIINGRYPPLGSLRTSQADQVAERWYFFFHQHPDLVETLVSKNVRAYYHHFLDHWSHPSFSYTEDDIAEYVRAYSQPGAIRGGCAHYQAALNEDEAQWASDVGKKIGTPTLILWGEDDPCSPPYYTDGYHRVFTDSTFHFIAACGHFPHEERPEETVSAIRDFLAERRD
ncbi:MAG TPA: alpha/beta hydrolase [Rhodospirillales bacterium]|jgi:haloacetate dehalogenase|nr:alpha/beta hydrolase [Rhodospirillales bacterium]